MQSCMDAFPDLLNKEVLIESLSPEFNANMVFKAGEGAGRSGSFFFFSHDNKFIIKTMTKDELNIHLKMLDDYLAHLKMYPKSLVARILGVFSIKTPHVGKTHFMLMQNTLQIRDQSELQFIFDMKGSAVDRRVSGEIKPSTTLKDENFLMAVKKLPLLTMLSDKDRT